MYRMGIWLIALALVVNGVAMTAWSGPAKTPVAITQSHHADAGSADCNSISGAAAAVVKYSDQTHGRMHNHLKCCGTCTVASLVPDFIAVRAVFNYQSAAFWTAEHHLDGHLVLLDPDIPKSIV